MTGLSNFQAFIIGLIIGVFIPLVFIQIRKVLPQISNQSQLQKTNRKNNRETDIENKIRLYFIQLCQRNHLLGFVCPLDDVFVETKLMSHYYYTNPDDLLDNEPLLYQLFPDLSDLPELTTVFPYPSVTLETAIQNRNNFALMGDIGTGKTATLSQFASKLLKQNSVNNQHTNTFPLYFHCHDFLEFPLSGELIPVLSDLLISKINGLDNESTKDFLSRFYDDSRLTLIVDGLDELPQSEMDALSSQLVQLSRSMPKLQIITAIGLYYTSTLADGNFNFYTMVYPRQETRREILTNVFRVLSLDNDPLSISEYIKMFDYWDLEGFSQLSIGEFVIKSLKSVFNSDQLDSEVTELVTLIIEKPDIYKGFTALATKVYANSFLPISKEIVRQFLNDASIESQILLENQSKINIGTQGKKNQFERLDAMLELVRLGVLKECRNNKLAFMHPILVCDFLSSQNIFDSRTEAVYELQNPYANYLLRNNYREFKYINQWISRPFDPLQNVVLSNTIRHILSKKQIDLQQILTSLLKIFSSSDYPFSSKMKSFYCLSKLNIDIHLVLDELSKHSSDKQFINRMIAISLPKLPIAIQDNVFRQVSTVSDPLTLALSLLWFVPSGKRTDILKIKELFRISSEPALNIIAELIALNTINPESIFKELSSSPGISLRKAAVHGLKFIQTSWAKDELERILTEDDQWIIRDACSHALESPWENRFTIPQKREKPNQASWLLQQASYRGIGIPANQYPEDLLMSIIEEGSLEEKKVALGYLLENPTKRALKTLQSLTQYDNPLQNDSEYYLNRIMTQKKFIDLLV